MAFFLLPAFPARADDREALQKIYSEMQENYIDEMDAGTLAVAALKKINALDKKFVLADDRKRLTVYYDAALIRSFAKPENRDVEAWAALTAGIVEEASKLSGSLAKNDFRMVDVMMYHAFKELDFGSKYYPHQDIGLEEKEKIPTFASREMDEMDGILYVRIGNFNPKSHGNVLAAVNGNPPEKGMIIDLRGNPGGLLGQAVEIARLFLDGGIVASVQSHRADSVTDFYVAGEGDVLKGLPMVIIVDGKTASSAELLAAALQEQGRAKLLGGRTLGKGSVQNLVSLPGGSALALTNAEFFSPSGRKMDKSGLEPDIGFTSAREEAYIEEAVKILLTNG